MMLLHRMLENIEMRNTTDGNTYVITCRAIIDGRTVTMASTVLINNRPESLKEAIKDAEQTFMNKYTVQPTSSTEVSESIAWEYGE